MCIRDSSQIASILTRINRACDGKGVRISVPSQRLDSFGVDMAELVAGQKKGGLTFAPEADAAMRAHAEAGDTVVVISATFEPIILRAMERHPFDNQISTRMSVATDGTYTRAVEGLPVEGEEKLAAVRRFGDSRFGPGNWELAYAYGDHHSDRAVLSAAEHPRAVSPDRPLARTAREKGWEILDW